MVSFHSSSSFYSVDGNSINFILLDSWKNLGEYFA